MQRSQSGLHNAANKIIAKGKHAKEMLGKAHDDRDELENVVNAGKAEWELDPLKAVSCQPPKEEKQISSAGDLQLQILHEKERDLEDDPDPWFQEGTVHYKRRQACLKTYKDPRFTNFFTFLILLNALTLGINANDAIDAGVSQAIETIFTLFYTYEIYVRAYGGSRYPWLTPSLVLDSILWLIAAVDLWGFAILSILLDMERPNMSVVMVLRLFRLTRILKAAEKFASFARPLRVIQLVAKELTGIMLANGLLLIIFIFFNGVVMRSMTTFQDDELIISSHFGNVWESMYTFFIALTGYNWADMCQKLKDEAGGYATFYFRLCIYNLLLLHFLIVACMVEQLMRAAKVDDQKQDIKGVRDAMKLDKIKRALEIIDMNNDGDLATEELTHAYMKHPVVANVLQLSLDQAINLHKDLDRKYTGQVPISTYLVGMFRLRCSAKDVESLLFERTLDECETESQRALEASQDYAAKVKVRSKFEEAAEAKRDEKADGLSNEVHRLHGGVVEAMNSMNCNYFDFVRAIDDLEGHLDHLRDIVAREDWSGETGAPEGAVRIASMKFAAELKCFATLAQDWVTATQEAEEGFYTREKVDNDLLHMSSLFNSSTPVPIM